MKLRNPPLAFIFLLLLTIITLIPLSPHKTLSHLTLSPPCLLLHLSLSPPSLHCPTSSSPNFKYSLPSLSLPSLLLHINSNPPLSFSNILLPPSSPTYFCLSRLVPVLSFPPQSPTFFLIPAKTSPFQNPLLQTPSLIPSHQILILSRASLSLLSTSETPIPSNYTQLVQTLSNLGALPVTLRASSNSPPSRNCTLQKGLVVIPNVRHLPTCNRLNKPLCSLNEPLANTPRFTISDVSFLVMGLSLPHANRTVRSIRALYGRHVDIVAEATGLEQSVTVVSGGRDALLREANAQVVCFVGAGVVMGGESGMAGMLKELEKGMDVVGGRVVVEQGPDEERLQSVGGWSGVGFRYGFGDEDVMKREVIGGEEFSGGGVGDCFRIHRPGGGFWVGRKGRVETFGKWARRGGWQVDEFWIRVMRLGGRVAVCDVAVLDEGAGEWVEGKEGWDGGKVVEGGKNVCDIWKRDLGDVWGIRGRGWELDCLGKRVCRKVGGGWNCRMWEE